MGGIELLATGRIDRLLDQYAVHVAVNQVSTGTLVTQANVQVPDLDGVFVAMRTLAAEVGQAIGDSDRQVTADAPLERVSTVSLDALRDYSAGMALINEFQRPAAEARLPRPSAWTRTSRRR